MRRSEVSVSCLLSPTPAAKFKPGSESTIEILQADESEGIGYWVGLQKAAVRMEGKPEPVPMSVRVTEIYKKEHGQWRLIHRHADMQAEASKP